MSMKIFGKMIYLQKKMKRIFGLDKKYFWMKKNSEWF